MSRVLLVVVICSFGLSSSLTLLLGFGLNLRSGGLPASKEQPQQFTLPLGSGVVKYFALKVHFSTCSEILVGTETPGYLRQNFWLPKVLAQTVGTSDCH